MNGALTTQPSMVFGWASSWVAWLTRSVTRIVNDNSLEYAMYLAPKGGKEEKMMEMTVTRKR